MKTNNTFSLPVLDYLDLVPLVSSFHNKILEYILNHQHCHNGRLILDFDRQDNSRRLDMF
jgi:hypothetical protein